MSRQVAILGGGISGLATAEALERRAEAAGTPLRVTVLEEGDTPGGKIQSYEKHGFVVETGPHGFLDKEPKMFELIDRLGLRDELVPANVASARRFVARAGKLRELPHSPLHAIWSDILPLSGKLRIALEPFMSGPTDHEESVRAFAARRIGPQAADVLVDAMVTGIYGGDPNRLSLASAFPRMFELERDHGSLFKAQFAVAKQRRAERALAAGNGAVVPAQSGTGAPVGTLHSFRRGLGTLTRALAARVNVSCESSVQALEAQEGKWRVRTSGETLEVDAVVSTVPSFVAQELVGPHAPAIAESIGAIHYAPCSVVVQAFKQEDVARSTDGFGFLIPGREKRDLLGSIWASTVFPVHAPEGQVMFRSMLGGRRRPELGRASPEELAGRARQELERWMGLRAGAEPVLEEVIPWPQAIPQYEMGHASRVEAADEVERALPGLFLSGNAFRGVAMLACVAEADTVSERVMSHLASLPAAPKPQLSDVAAPTPP
ncbi:MAG: protoporphyrinogen oxidase [Myxococcota bacterium]